jgi:hypothetical protein
VSIQERLTLRNLYLYLVCLVTLVMSIFAAVNLVRGTVELLYPDPGYYAYGASDKEPGVSQEEQRRRQQAARDAQRRQAVLDLVGSGTLFLVAAPLYAYHWRRVQRELPDRRSPSPEGSPPTP